MIIGIGVDIVRISKFKKLSEKAVKRLFTAEEIRLFKVRKPERMAVNFAAKEALIKALGRSISWKEVEVLRDKGGKPYIKSSGKLRELLGLKGIRNIHLSMSHEGDYAIAFLILEGGN